FKLTNTIQEALQADVVALAMPVSAILAFLRKEGAHLRPGTIVFDLGSTKKLIAETAKRTLPRGVCFVGGHPVAGKAVGGFANSEADLFQGRPFVLSVGSSPPERRAAREIERLILRIGGRPHRMNAADHDRMLALTSHLPQLLATALAATASRTLGRRLPIHGSAFFEMTRVAESDFVVWKDILETNKLYIANILVSYQNILQSFINYGDGRATQALFDEGCRFRKKLRLKKESSC
ncbi:MAG TPA: hypothetical protein DCS07_13035, partial [Bdellovibrionales bacterium]|nr:hypothetical protein [Bdellovibrionales bacterium]